MKKIRSVLLIALGFIIGYQGVEAVATHVQRNAFPVVSRAASGAVFLDQYDGGQRKFICSGTVIGHMGPDALFLTARHCIWESASKGDWFEGPTTAHLLGPEEVSFSDNEQGPFYTAVPFRVSAIDDIAILRVINGGNIPQVALGDERRLHAGEPLTSYPYPMDFGKMDLLLKAVVPAFAHLRSDLLDAYPEWGHAMPVDGTVAPGSSGSGLFALNQQALVAVAVGTVRFGGLNIVIPVSRVWTLLEHPETSMPESILIPSPKKADAEVKGITIPDEEFNRLFGEKHLFMLKVRGPDPQFVQAGYTFKIQAGGFELYEPYYYKVPVFIAKDGAGYRITTTEKTHASIEVVVLSKGA